MFDATVREGVLRLRRPGTRWLSTGWAGGRSRGDAVYNVSVPEGFDRTDLAAYRDERLARAGFTEKPCNCETDRAVPADRDAPPTLFTGVAMEHARGARRGPVVAYATAGLSNPATLPMEPEREATDSATHATAVDLADAADSIPHGPGTVNLILGTTRRLAPGAAANLVAVAAESKAVTLLHTAGVPGTTSDAVVVGDDPTGESAAFSGSATPVGAAARVCVRDAVRASLRSRYPNDEFPGPPADAEHGVVADGRAEVFNP
ncbi:adenosylcobinamide amidohydrolase [Halorubrum laminariae]|uniref:Adenosylcobinamide amidohydrolase n=1 Tax=Halorubrum laminariae TaxID=1433523 RepID=A0ABD6C0P2_9EURY|nr:adenosylcobinamide amidohydrolase [Halorubrum laminariae]